MPGSTSTCAAPGRSPPQRTAALARLAETHRLARLTRHGELIAQRVAPTVRMGKATVALPPGAFLQATAEGEAVLARLVSEHVGNAKVVADLFCGVGPFALRLAERARVIAADADAAAIAALAPGGKDAWPQADRGRGARPVPPPARAGGAEAPSTRSCSIRRARARRRRRASLPRQAFRWSSRCRAMPRPSRATRASWRTAATG